MAKKTNSKNTLKILIIEDYENTSYLIRTILEDAFHEVISATEPKKGLRLAKNELPDLILLDLNLPGMHGYDVFRHLRADKATKDIPIIAVTIMSMTGDKERALEIGFDGYIEKPFDPRKFIPQIEEILKEKDNHAVK